MEKGIDKAIERALEKYPQRSVLVVPARGGGYYADSHLREGFIEGYHQAEKDLELSWEDIETIQEMANKYCKHHSCEPRFFVYSEILKRFKSLKHVKQKI